MFRHRFMLTTPCHRSWTVTKEGKEEEKFPTILRHLKRIIVVQKSMILWKRGSISKCCLILDVSRLVILCFHGLKFVSVKTNTRGGVTKYELAHTSGSLMSVDCIKGVRGWTVWKHWSNISDNGWWHILWALTWLLTAILVTLPVVSFVGSGTMEFSKYYHTTDWCVVSEGHEPKELCLLLKTASIYSGITADFNIGVDRLNTLHPIGINRCSQTVPAWQDGLEALLEGRKNLQDITTCIYRNLNLTSKKKSEKHSVSVNATTQWTNEHRPKRM